MIIYEFYSHLNNRVVKSFNFLSHSREENRDSLDRDEGHHLDHHYDPHHDHNHHLDHQEDGAVLDEAHHRDGGGGEHLVEAGGLLSRVGGEGAVERSGDCGDVELSLVASDGVNNT